MPLRKEKGGRGGVSAENGFGGWDEADVRANATSESEGLK